MNKKKLNFIKNHKWLRTIPLVCSFVAFCTAVPTAQAAYTIDTIGGTGTYSSSLNLNSGAGIFSESDGSIFSAPLAKPVAIVKDITDNSLVFIDHDHSAIRRITLSGTVSTILSGFNVNSFSPQHLTIDSATGSLYATDGQNVFCITKTNGVYGTPHIFATTRTDDTSNLGWSGVTPTYANCWFSALANPQAIAFAPLSGGAGPYAYVGGVGTIYQIDLNASNVTNSHYAYRQIVSGLNYPSGLALNASNTSLFVADNPDQGSATVIRRFAVPSISDTAATYGVTIAGIYNNPASGNNDSIATDSGLSPSSHIAVDSDGGLYISETDHNLIRYVPAITSGSYTSGYIYTIAGGGILTTNSIAATTARLYGPTGLFVDSNKTIFITEGNDSTSGNNFIRRIAFSPAAISLAPSSTNDIAALTVPYYSKVAFSGGGTARITAGNSDTLYGGVVLSDAGTTLELSHLAESTVDALGAGVSPNILTMGTGTVLQAGSDLTETPSIIPVPIHYAGSVTIDTADDAGDTHSLGTLAITSTASGQNTITVKGGGTYTPGADYTTGGTDVLELTDSGTKLKLISATHVPATVRLGGGTTLQAGNDVTSSAISYSGGVTLDTATHSLGTVAITCTAGDDTTNTITVKGGGTYTPGAAYTASTGRDTLAVVDSGTTLTLTDTNYVPSTVNLGAGTTLSLGCNLTSTSLVIN